MATESTRVCWSCRGWSGGEPFCPTCGAIQPPPPGVDHFARFGLPMAFRLDEGVLAERYRREQQRFHPDHYQGRSPTERRLATGWVMLLNEGYQVLRDDWSRANYLVTLLGGATAAAAAPELLMEVMAWRERMEAIDPADPQAAGALVAMRQALGEQEREVVARLGDLGVERVLEAARLVDRCRYLRRLLEEVERLEEQVESWHAT